MNGPVPHPLLEVCCLVELGIGRVLTSAGCPTVLDGIDRLVRLVSRAAERIGILPAEGSVPTTSIASCR